MGRISNIEIQKNNKKRYNIYVDNEYAFSVSEDVLIKESLQKGLDIDDNKLSNIIQEDNFIKCRETAFRIIERSYKSEKELKERLLEKGYNNIEINRTIDYLKEYNFVDNEKLCEMYIKSKIKTQGKKKIKYQLLHKGIDEETINNVLDNIDSESEYEREKAIEVATKKYNLLIKKEEDIYKIKGKLYAFLAGRGYEYSIIQETISKIINKD
ncbi:recombination regulator RecX [Clostridium sp. MSJ-8]|uniref:recombination regulator RecX n=1 Tax=Clostridium sp. MSJ-8 TaxID=2841510 RepID=UPI001C0EB762|nr:recombination regulator RecX [Clostridium sp. MSJ-8]MBU5487598.1 recombination regulator RecX [Clostridium sp. MSJ-8]